MTKKPTSNKKTQIFIHNCKAMEDIQKTDERTRKSTLLKTTSIITVSWRICINIRFVAKCKMLYAQCAMMNQEREDNKRINFAVLLSEVRFLVFFFTPEFLVLFTEQFCIVLPHHCLVQCILPSVFLHHILITTIRESPYQFFSVF